MQVSQKIQEIYIGLLGRAADQDGLNYWVNEYQTGILDYNQIRENLVNSQPEYASGLGSMDRPAVVTELYNRYFQREPEADGFAYWTSGEGASVPVDLLVLALANGAGTEDRTILDNKINASDWYTNNFIYTPENAAFVVSEITTYASVEGLKAANEVSSSFNLNAKNFNVSGLDQAINFVIDPGKVGTPSAENYQTIEGIHGFGQLFDPGNASLVYNETASAGIAAIDMAGIASFDSTDTTLAQHIIAAEAGIATGEATAGQAAMWQEGPDTFIFFSDGVDGVGENDNLVKLVGIDSSSSEYNYLVDVGTSFALT